MIWLEYVSSSGVGGDGHTNRCAITEVKRLATTWRAICVLVALFAIGCERAAPPLPKPEKPQVTVDPKIANAGVIVCKHVASEGAPILRAVRDEPMDPDDSGWQVLCNSGKDERIDDAQIWAVNEVVEHDPTLAEFINSDIGTVMARQDASSQWSASK